MDNKKITEYKAIPQYKNSPSILFTDFLSTKIFPICEFDITLE